MQYEFVINWMKISPLNASKCTLRKVSALLEKYDLRQITFMQEVFGESKTVIELRGEAKSFFGGVYK